MSVTANIPVYDPEADAKILRLKENFARMGQVFSYALPESRRNDQEIHGVPNRYANGVYSGLRRAWLSRFPDIASFKADIFPPSGFHLIESPLERRLREGLKDLFVRKSGLPYGQPTYAVEGPVFESGNIFYGELSFENYYRQNKKKGPPNEWDCKTFQIVERAPTHLNICYIRSSYNGLPYGIDDCADETVRVINRRYNNAARGIPVQIFLFVPAEAGNGGPQGFVLIDRLHDGALTPRGVPLDRLPPAIERLYYKHHKRIQPNLAGPGIDSPYMDFRGFALRTMTL